MAKTIDLTKTDGVIQVSVNGAAPRSLADIKNITVKPLEDGVVVKLTDESWRLTILLEDTVTEDTVQKSPYADVTAMVDDLSSYFV